MSYPEDWDERRRRVYQRDDYCCQNCGAGGGPHGETELHAHHIVPKSRGGRHDLSNLVTLCKDCHWQAHYKRAIPWKEYTGPFWRWYWERFRLSGLLMTLILFPVTFLYLLWRGYDQLRTSLT